MEVATLVVLGRWLTSLNHIVVNIPVLLAFRGSRSEMHLKHLERHGNVIDSSCLLSGANCRVMVNKSTVIDGVMRV